MSHERPAYKGPKKPYEVFGLTEGEHLNWRVSNDRFKVIIDDDQTIVHSVKESSNNYGEFLFVTASRHGDQGRICMTFYGCGYHEHRERWISNEWFWYQDNPFPDMLAHRIAKEEADELLQQRLKSIQPYIQPDTQTDRGRLFEILADLTDEDGALAELEDIDELSGWIDDEPKIVPPTGENLLDKESRERLPPLYRGEEQGLDTLAQVKFFTPWSNWTWYSSEYDGNDTLFGLVIGFEIEMGYFCLSELQQVRSPLGLEIERDLHFEPKSLRELMEMHQRERRG